MTFTPRAFAKLEHAPVELAVHEAQAVDRVHLRAEHGDLVNVSDERPVAVLAIDVVEQPLGALRPSDAGGNEGGDDKRPLARGWHHEFLAESGGENFVRWPDGRKAGFRDRRIRRAAPSQRLTADSRRGRAVWLALWYCVASFSRQRMSTDTTR